MNQDWPPKIPQEKKQKLHSLASQWSFLNGLIIRNPASDPLATHAPFALFPSPFPRYLIMGIYINT